MINVNQITAQMARMSDQALQQYAEMHKDDPYTLSLALNESNQRKQMRAEAQTGPDGAEPTVAEQGIASIAEQPQPQMLQGQPQQQMPQGLPPQGQMAQAAPMPEDVGIGALPAPNMQNMAEGGIVSFADRGLVGGTGTPSTDAFEQAFQTVLRFEGGAKFVADDAGKGPTKYGINQTANPDLDVKNLTEDQAREIYRKRYWNKINGDVLAAKNPTLATIAFDAAVNQGAGTANKMVAAASGDPTKLLELRKQRYDALVQAKPDAYKQFSKGWDARLASLATAAIPIGSAQAAPTAASAAPADTTAAERIPGYTGKAPAATPDQSSWLAKKATEMGVSEDAQRNISNLTTAAGGAMGAGYIPSYLPKVGGGIAALGERAAELINPSKQLTAAQIQAMQAANTAERVAKAGQFVGPVSETAQAARAADLAKLAQVPSKAEQIQTASMLRQAQEANRIAAAGKAVQYGGQAAASPDLGQLVPSAAETAPVASDENRMAAQEDFRRREYEGMNTPSAAPASAVAAPDAAAAPTEKPSWLTNDRALMMGLQMLAGSGKPGSGSAIRDLLSSAGSAGLGTLTQEREERKAKATETETTAKGKYYGALADMTERGGKEKNEVQLAEKTAQEALTNWAKSNQLEMLKSPGLYEQMRSKYRMEAYNQYGIPMQAAATAGASSRQGWGTATAQ